MCNLVVIIELYVEHLYCVKTVIHIGKSQYERNLLLCMNVVIHVCFGEGDTLYLKFVQLKMQASLSDVVRNTPIDVHQGKALASFCSSSLPMKELFAIEVSFVTRKQEGQVQNFQQNTCDKIFTILPTIFTLPTNMV